MARTARRPSRERPAATGRHGLAPYAASRIASRGRLVPEPDCDMRGAFQRDRDRIIHSSAFRRLTHKTQVFLYHEGDHYRTRLTHSIEVAQVARSIARQLKLDEDLAEALALAHDLGHPPFGHAGERALAKAARDLGGFDHNAQSLRVVTAIERRYAGFDGLNLSWETLEGLVKHNGPLIGPRCRSNHGLDEAIAAYSARHDLWLDRFASAEAQVAALADDIAYNSHDLDDGLRAGLIDFETMAEVPLLAEFLGEIEAAYGDLDPARRIYEVSRRLITAMIADVVRESRQRLTLLAPTGPDDVRNATEPVIAFSPRMTEAVRELSSMLFAEVYRAPRVMDRMRLAEQMVEELFVRYLDDPQALPEHWRQDLAGLDRRARGRRIVDFVAGMTDRFAIEEHRRLFAHTPELG